MVLRWSFITRLRVLQEMPNSLANCRRVMATELGVSVDYLVSGKEGIITDTVPAIKADKRLKIKAKKAIIAMVEELYAASDTAPATALSRDSGESKK